MVVTAMTEQAPSRSSRSAPRLRLTSPRPPRPPGEASSHSASGSSEDPEEVDETQAQRLQAAGQQLGDGSGEHENLKHNLRGHRGRGGVVQCV